MEKIAPIVKTLSSGKHEITLHIPNVRSAKENDLLWKRHGITHKMIEHNMELCGFDIVSYEEHNGSHTKITIKCCNVDCNGTCEKKYTNFISHESLPLCASCTSIVMSINRTIKRPIVAIKGSERIEYESIQEASKKLDIIHQNVYNYLKSGRTHSSGYKFEFLD